MVGKQDVCSTVQRAEVEDHEPLSLSRFFVHQMHDLTFQVHHGHPAAQQGKLTTRACALHAPVTPFTARQICRRHHFAQQMYCAGRLTISGGTCGQSMLLKCKAKLFSLTSMVLLIQQANS